MKEVRHILISRCIYSGISEEIHSCSLHGFGDASEKAYCAVVYLVMNTSSGTYVRLMSSKTRVSPINKTTIPRLELLSGLILARLMSSVKEALSKQITIIETHLWLDSITAIYWIKGSREWKQFVQNRVAEILQLTDRSMWHHCPGKENPADIGSRGEHAKALRDSKLWWDGPYWLKKPKEWPNQSQTEDVPEECVDEMKGRPQNRDIMNTATLLVTANELDLEKVIKTSDYSSAERLFRVTALVLRFINKLKVASKGQSERGVTPDVSELTEVELANAENVWLKDAQKSVKFQANYRRLQHELGLFEDENGVLRCNGRVANAEIPEQSKFPAFVPRESGLVRLLVMGSHRAVHHCKIGSTLAELRSY